MEPIIGSLQESESIGCASYGLGAWPAILPFASVSHSGDDFSKRGHCGIVIRHYGPQVKRDSKDEAARMDKRRNQGVQISKQLVKKQRLFMI